MRLSPLTDALVSEESKRTRRSKGAVVEALADEALRMRLFPGIAFRGVDWERRPWIIGTALDVWEVIAALHDFGDSVERMAAESDVSERHIRLAQSYHARFPADIDDSIARNSLSIKELQSSFPTIDVISPSAP